MVVAADAFPCKMGWCPAPSSLSLRGVSREPEGIRREGGKEEGREEEKLQDEMQEGSGAHCIRVDPPAARFPTKVPTAERCSGLTRAHRGLLAASEHLVMLALCPDHLFTQSAL